MKVAMVTPEFPPACGGIGYYVYYLANALAQKGVEVEVLVRGGVGGEAFGGVRFSCLPVPGVPPLNNPLFAACLRKRVAASGCDILHLHAASMPVAALDFPTVVTSHSCIGAITPLFYRPVRDGESLYRNLLLPVYRWIERRLVTSCDALTVVSVSMQEDYRRLYGVDGAVVYNGVDNDRFRPASSVPADGDAPRVLYVGALKRGKGLLDLIGAAALLGEKFPRLEIVLHGDGPLRRTLLKEIHRRGLKSIRMPGAIGHDWLPAELAAASVVVLPSYYEGLPNILLEAMACAAPVVATMAGGNAEVVRDGVNGFLVEPHDPAGLAHKIETLLKDPILSRRMGAAGRSLACEEYTWDKVSDRFMGIYRKVSGR
jgi:glycosyltransferase involved in cell wall biosynthesis